jgi:formate-dependent nitrite reductase membrane component NrfD
MVWGAWFLTAQGLLTTLWIVAAVAGSNALLTGLFWPLVLCSILTTGYTGFLFAQGLARDLWQGPLSTVDLFAQATVEGSAVLLLASLYPDLAARQFTRALTLTLIVAMLVHLAVIVFEHLLATGHTRHRQLAVNAIRRGAFARLFWGGAISAAAGSILAAALFPGLPGGPLVAALLALGGSFAWEYVWVEAGQSVPLS